MQPCHGEEEDGVGVAAARGILAHTLVRLQRLSTRDEEDLELQTGVSAGIAVCHMDFCQRPLSHEAERSPPDYNPDVHYMGH